MIGRKARVALGIVGILAGIAGLLGIAMDRRDAKERERVLTMLADDFRERERERREPGFHAGDRVRIVKWAGTFKPEDTGAPGEVSAGPGQTGIVVRMEKRESTGPVQIARVRWLPQRWKKPGREQWVELPEFEATIHMSYLERVP